MELNQETIQVLKSLLEDTVGASAPNIATTDQNLPLTEMYQQIGLPSLGRQIFSSIPLSGPTGALFNVRRKDGTDNFEILRNDVEAYPSAMIQTGMTQEVISDIETQFGRNGRTFVATLLRGIANEVENTKTLAFLNAESLSTPALTLTDAKNSFNTFNEVSQSVLEQIIDMNMKNTITYDSWCVLPAKVAASFAVQIGAHIGGQKPSGLCVGSSGLTKFYINPDASSTKAYVGLISPRNISKSSGVFSSYHEEIVEATDPDDGASVMFIVNRFAITASPLHQVNDEMFRMFDIT
jgi:hypothetical protein